MLLIILKKLISAFSRFAQRNFFEALKVVIIENKNENLANEFLFIRRVFLIKKM